MGRGSGRHAVMAGGGALTVAAALALALGGAAEGRGDPDPQCPAGALCVWEHADFDGKRVVITGLGISNEIAEKMNDAVSSAFNRRGKVSKLYVRKNANGEVFCLSPQDEVLFVGGGFNDLASSSKLTKKSDCPL